jgi:Glycosyltransferases involved in cell wall biogenesis
MGLTCSIVIPVYNSQATLRELVTRLSKVMPPLCDEFEVILVNDGSHDQSWQAICDLSEEFPWIRGINMMRNYGQHNALLCGLRTARYEITITMDDDLQHPPEEIGALLPKFSEGFEVVYGIPRKLPHSLWRNLLSFLTKRILAFVMNIPTVRDLSAFRAFRTDLRKAFESFQSPNVILDVLLSWGTTRFTTVMVDEAPRLVGISNYNFSKLIGQGMLILTGFSTAPLRLASMIGFAFTIFGIAIFAYVITLYFIAGSIPGFPFLASIIALFSGTQLFTLGIFGEYLASIFDRSMDRPVYVVGGTTEKNDSKSNRPNL